MKVSVEEELWKAVIAQGKENSIPQDGAGYVLRPHPNVRNQHIIPQFLLKNFQADHKDGIYAKPIYYIEGDEINKKLPRIRPIAIKKVTLAKKNWPMWIEARIGEYENRCSPIINAIISEVRAGNCYQFGVRPLEDVHLRQQLFYLNSTISLRREYSYGNHSFGNLPIELQKPTVDCLIENWYRPWFRNFPYVYVNVLGETDVPYVLPFGVTYPSPPLCDTDLDIWPGNFEENVDAVYMPIAPDIVLCFLNKKLLESEHHKWLLPPSVLNIFAFIKMMWQLPDGRREMYANNKTILKLMSYSYDNIMQKLGLRANKQVDGRKVFSQFRLDLFSEQWLSELSKTYKEMLAMQK